MTFTENAFSVITNFSDHCSAEEGKALEADAKKFMMEIKDLPLHEQASRFNDKYGALLDYARGARIISYSRRINSKMKFIVILVIISLLASLFSIL